MNNHTIIDGLTANTPVLAYKTDIKGWIMEIKGAGLDLMGTNEEKLKDKKIEAVFPESKDGVAKGVAGEVKFTTKGKGWEMEHYLYPDNTTSGGIIGYAFKKGLMYDRLGTCHVPMPNFFCTTQTNQNMPYDEYLADRIRNAFKAKKAHFEEKKMMGGICFMVDDKMCAGVVKDQLMARIDPDIYEEVLAKKGCREMDFTKRPMKGFVFVDPIGTDMDSDLEYWIQQCLDFNPKAKSSKKKK